MLRTRSSSTYDPLPVVVDPEPAMTGQPAVIHQDFPNNLAVALVPSGTGVAPDKRRQHRDRQGVCRCRSRHLPAHGEPPPRAERDGAARRAGALGAGQGHDDHLVVDAEPAHPQDDDRGDERPGTAPGPRHRAGSGRRLRREDQHLRRGICRAAVSKQLGLPIKWIEDRSEAFVATTHGRDIIGYVDVARAKRRQGRSA